MNDYIKICRIDDRLIHGQVITTWVNVYKIEQVIILNEELVHDAIQTNVLKMSAPPNIKLHVFSPAKFMEIIAKNPLSRNTMLLFSSVFDVLEVVNSGLVISKLNVGGMRLEGNREQLTKAVSVNKEERQAFKTLLEKGVDVEIQMLPTNEATNMKGVL